MWLFSDRNGSKDMTFVFEKKILNSANILWSLEVVLLSTKNLVWGN